MINIVINPCEWLYSEVFLHRTLIRRRLSLFSPPSSSLTEDYSFVLIAQGPGAGDSRWCHSLRPGKRTHCILWTSQPMHKSSPHRGGCRGWLGASHGSAGMIQTAVEVWLQPGTCLSWVLGLENPPPGHVQMQMGIWGAPASPWQRMQSPTQLCSNTPRHFSCRGPICVSRSEIFHRAAWSQGLLQP